MEVMEVTEVVEASAKILAYITAITSITTITFFTASSPCATGPPRAASQRATQIRIAVDAWREGR